MDTRERRTLNVGDAVIRRPLTLSTRDNQNLASEYRKGKVVYVHPQGRYHIVEFGESSTAFRECFLGVGS